LVIADVGTGSGCLAVCLALEFPDARVIATDVSPPALAIAARNARRHGVAERTRFLRTSLLDGVRGPFALIASNPPYIPTGGPTASTSSAIWSGRRLLCCRPEAGLSWSSASVSRLASKT
jgi:HemK-like putative methylase